MFTLAPLALLSIFSGSVCAGTTIWSGSFNSYPNVSVFDNCEPLISIYLPWFWQRLILSPIGSWSNEVGEYQWVCKDDLFNLSHY